VKHSTRATPNSCTPLPAHQAVPFLELGESPANTSTLSAEESAKYRQRAARILKAALTSIVDKPTV
jgi:hypothetical protein